MLRDLFSLFPAYAGVIPGWLNQNNNSGTFPRIRGGDPDSYNREIASIAFSPHMRG